MEKFEVHVLGCGSALPTTRHNPSAQVVSLCEKLYMVDCGEGVQLQLRRSRLRFSRLTHIFITHLHGDHCFGLPGLVSTFALLGRTADMHVYGPADLEKVMRPLLDYFCSGSPFDVIFHTVDTTVGGTVYEDRSVLVEAFPLQHRKPCVGYLFREKPTLPHIKRDMIDFLGIPHFAINDIKSGGGWTTAEGVFYPHERLVTPAEPPRSYAYCSDTRFVPELAETLRGVDLLFHEATFSESDAARAAETMHSTAAQAAMMAKLAEVRRLLIGHFSARYEDEGVLLKEAKAVFENTLMAREGLCVSI